MSPKTLERSTARQKLARFLLSLPTEGHTVHFGELARQWKLTAGALSHIISHWRADGTIQAVPVAGIGMWVRVIDREALSRLVGGEHDGG